MLYFTDPVTLSVFSQVSWKEMFNVTIGNREKTMSGFEFQSNFLQRIAKILMTRDMCRIVCLQCSSQFPRAQGNIFECFLLSDQKSKFQIPNHIKQKSSKT